MVICIYIYIYILTGAGKNNSIFAVSHEGMGLLKSPLAYSSSEPTKDHLGFELSTIYYMIHGDH